jgi:hypothetical protein
VLGGRRAGYIQSTSPTTFTKLDDQTAGANDERVSSPGMKAPAMIAVAKSVRGNIVAHTSGIYWGAEDGVHWLSRTPGADAAVAQTVPTVSAVTVKGNVLYFSRYEFNSIGGYQYSCPLPGCTQLNGGEALNHESDLLWAGSNVRVYIAWPPANQLIQASYAWTDSDGRLDAGVVPNARWMATDGEFAYVPTSEGIWRITVGVPPTTTGKVETLVATTASDRVTSIATDGIGKLFFGQGKALRRCVVTTSTCTSTIVASASDAVSAVAVGGQYVYYATEKGEVFRIDKPGN